MKAAGRVTAFPWLPITNTASRLIPVGEETFTLGVLVQSNYGGLSDLTINGRRMGMEILARREEEAAQAMDRGSIMMIAATDMPVSDRQLRRILKRCCSQQGRR